VPRRPAPGVGPRPPRDARPSRGHPRGTHMIADAASVAAPGPSRPGSARFGDRGR
jgi:hypothetical protein